jgi:hypothetical protein
VAHPSVIGVDDQIFLSFGRSGLGFSCIGSRGWEQNKDEGEQGYYSDTSHSRDTQEVSKPQDEVDDAMKAV